MIFAVKFQYHYRLGYGSEERLIEFLNAGDNKTFIPVFLSAIQSLQPIIAKVEDVWMNDEIWVTIHTSKGSVTYSADIWGFFFIMDNQPCLRAIHELLQGDMHFEYKEFEVKR